MKLKSRFVQKISFLGMLAQNLVSARVKSHKKWLFSGISYLFFSLRDINMVPVFLINCKTFFWKKLHIWRFCIKFFFFLFLVLIWVKKWRKVVMCKTSFSIFTFWCHIIVTKLISIFENKWELKFCFKSSMVGDVRPKSGSNSGQKW